MFSFKASIRRTTRPVESVTQRVYDGLVNSLQENDLCPGGIPGKYEIRVRLSSAKNYGKFVHMLPDTIRSVPVRRHTPFARVCILNSGMERITDIGILLSCFQEEEEETMVSRFRGIDRNKKYSIVSVLDGDGRETRFLRSCQMETYLGELGPEDAVVIEASCGSFYWVDRVEATGATCYIPDPMRSRIITDFRN